MVSGERAQSHERHRGGKVGLLSQRPHLFGRTAGDRASAHVKDGTLGRGDGTRRLQDLPDVSLERRPVAG